MAHSKAIFDVYTHAKINPTNNTRTWYNRNPLHDAKGTQAILGGLLVTNNNPVSQKYLGQKKLQYPYQILLNTAWITRQKGT